jgi:hypothetical protein
MGQAIRFDTGDGNIATNNTIGSGGGIEAGEAYGISLRLGERNSIMSFNTITGCRHSIEFWSTSGGCIAEDNILSEDTSSSLDTHGAWNTGVILRRNTITRTGAALYSTDSGATTDAIRVGNPKFIWDEDIQVIDNIVDGYLGVGLAIIPGARNVTVDGLIINNVERGVQISNNGRHTNLFCDNIVIRNITLDNVANRLVNIQHASSTVVCKNLLLKDWVVGSLGAALASPVGTHTFSDASTSSDKNIQIHDCEDAVLDNIDIRLTSTTTDDYVWWFEDVTGLTLTGIRSVGGQRGITFRDVTGLSGTATIRDLTDTPSSTALLVRADGTNSGSLTVTHNQTGAGTPANTPDELTLSFSYVA